MVRGRENSLHRMTRIAHDACMGTTGETRPGGGRGARGHGARGGGAMSARLRGVARQTEQPVRAERCWRPPPCTATDGWCWA
jgi:hypothetical protein